MSNQNGGLLFIAGFVTGGMIGASLALLLAPQSGKETRDQIRNKGIELKDGAVEGFTGTSQSAQTQIANWQEALEKGKHSKTATASHSIDKITQAVNNSKAKVVKAVA